MLRENENGEGDVRTRADLQEEKRPDDSLKGTSEVTHRDVNVSGKSERVIAVQWCLHGVAIGEVVFSKKRINKHFLMNPQFTSLQVALKLNAEKIPKRP